MNKNTRTFLQYFYYPILKTKTSLMHWKDSKQNLRKNKNGETYIRQGRKTTEALKIYNRKCLGIPISPQFSTEIGLSL